MIFYFCLFSVSCWDINFVSFCLICLNPGALNHRLSAQVCWNEEFSGRGPSELTWGHADAQSLVLIERVFLLIVVSWEVGADNLYVM